MLNGSVPSTFSMLSNLDVLKIDGVWGECVGATSLTRMSLLAGCSLTGAVPYIDAHFAPFGIINQSWQVI
jgi:hypothetical protein